MKKLITLALMLTFACVVSAETQMVRLTRFEGLDIQGIVASNAFMVEVYQSDKTYATVEIPAEYEDRLIFDFDNKNNINIGIKSSPKTIFRKDMPLTAKVYVKELSNINGSGAVKFKMFGEFKSSAINIKLGGASKLSDLKVDASARVFVDCSGASNIDAVIDTRLLRCEISGASRANINVKAEEGVFNLGGASRIEAQGRVDKLQVGAGGASAFEGRGVSSREAKLNATGASKINIGETGSLNAEANSASSIRFMGSPSPLNMKSNSASSIKQY